MKTIKEFLKEEKDPRKEFDKAVKRVVGQMNNKDLTSAWETFWFSGNMEKAAKEVLGDKASKIALKKLTDIFKKIDE